MPLGFPISHNSSELTSSIKTADTRKPQIPRYQNSCKTWYSPHRLQSCIPHRSGRPAGYCPASPMPAPTSRNLPPIEPPFVSGRCPLPAPWLIFCICPHSVRKYGFYFPDDLKGLIRLVDICKILPIHFYDFQMGPSPDHSPAFITFPLVQSRPVMWIRIASPWNPAPPTSCSTCFSPSMTSLS